MAYCGLQPNKPKIRIIHWTETLPQTNKHTANQQQRPQANNTQNKQTHGSETNRPQTNKETARAIKPQAQQQNTKHSSNKN